jgi:hypothetical protein
MSAQKSQGQTRHYVSPADEQRRVPAGIAAPLVRRNAKGQPVDSAAASALAKRPRRSTYLPRKIACDPRFEVHNANRIDWTRTRMRELVDLTGATSHGVAAMVVCAGWLYAGAMMASERAAESGDLELFRTAAALSATARTHDFGAYELAVREAEARKSAAPAGDAMAKIRARIMGRT